MNGDVAPNNCLIGRQPILNRNEEIVAYELLFRSVDSPDMATVTDSSRATASVIINTLSEFGLDQILGPHRGFINVDLDLLMNDNIEILPPERVVLELLETILVTPDLVERCRVLKQKGFVFALDDHIFDPCYHELYHLAEIVKLDLIQTPVGELPAMVANFRPYPVKLLAEKVESRDEYLLCLKMGFEYFQGFFFAKPSLMGKKRIDDQSSTLFNLMRMLAEDAELEKIEQAFRRNPGLTYKLLLLVNSVSTGIREKVESVRHAIVILGRQRIKRWIQLTLFASDDSRGIMNPLVDLAAVRAGFMEQLAIRHPLLKGRKDAGEQAFMVGILSLLEKIYKISADEIVTTLNLPNELREALTARKGALGWLLEFSEMMESSYFSLPSDQLKKLGLSYKDVQDAQLKAYQWLGE